MKTLILLSLILRVSSELTLERRPKIVGGEDAQIEEFPAVVAIIHLGYQSQWCAGTIISEQWVLTAAHCYIPPSSFVLEYATTDLLMVGQGAKHAIPELFITHESYNPNSLTFDVGIIKTRAAIETGLHSQFSRLAVHSSYYATGTPATVAGWGLWSYQNDTIPPLQKADLQVWHYRDCQRAHINNPYGLKIHNHQICAGVPDFSKAECSG